MIHVRKATEDDAEAIASVLAEVVAEGAYTAIDRAWPVEEQRQYLHSLSAREAFHVAETDDGEVVGYQSLDLYSSFLRSMSHVAQLGTFLKAKARGRGVGRALFAATLEFARVQGFRKMVILVRASNSGAQQFYHRLGFRPCGRLTRQVSLHGEEDDEIVMEFFVQ